jgi:hypothetical protein
MKRYTVTLKKGKRKRVIYVTAETKDGAVSLLKSMDEYTAWLVQEIRK